VRKKCRQCKDGRNHSKAHILFHEKEPMWNRRLRDLQDTLERLTDDVKDRDDDSVLEKIHLQWHNFHHELGQWLTEAGAKPSATAMVKIKEAEDKAAARQKAEEKEEEDDEGEEVATFREGGNSKKRRKVEAEKKE
jgi:hypothetical protein